MSQESDSRTHKTTVVCPYCGTTNNIMVNPEEFVDSSSMYVCDNVCCKENFFLEVRIIGVSREMKMSNKSNQIKFYVGDIVPVE